MFSLCLGRRRQAIRLPAQIEKEQFVFASHPISSRSQSRTRNDEKLPLPQRSLGDVVADIVKILHRPSDPTMQSSIKSTEAEKIVCASGWSSESIAESILNVVEAQITNESMDNWSETFKNACYKAKAEVAEIAELAGEFASEHPILTTVALAVLAIGILYLTLPVVLEWLGFSSLGPVEASFAAAWQARYLGRVPVGSVFAYLQRLGMTLRFIPKA